MHFKEKTKQKEKILLEIFWNNWEGKCYLPDLIFPLFSYLFKHWTGPRAGKMSILTVLNEDF